eukprot:453225_1
MHQAITILNALIGSFGDHRYPVNNEVLNECNTIHGDEEEKEEQCNNRLYGSDCPEWTRTHDAMLKKLNSLCEETRQRIYDNWSGSNWSYWNASMIIPKFLFLGDRSSAIDLEHLKKRNISYLLNCAGPKCTEYVVYDPNLFTVHMFSAKDNSTCQILNDHLNDAIQFIEEAKQNKKQILVHCVGGVNRSAVIVVAYLMYSRYKSNVFEASTYTISKRSSALRNLAFKKQLVQYQIYLDSQRARSKSKRD